VDRIEISGFGVTDLASLSFVTVPSGDAIDLGGGRFIVLEGLTSGQLQAGDVVGTSGARAYSLVSTTLTHRLTGADDRFISTDTGNAEIFGGAGVDALIGGSGDDTIWGEAGSDVIIGGLGDDRIIGGQGADNLTGRFGSDTFVFNSGEETGFTADFITDFEIGIDALELNGFGYTQPSDLLWTPTPSGVALQLAATHFVVFDSITDQTQIEAGAGNWVFA
jgi:Ca2+-binding RTX toxin-like protein